ncbi:MAG: hypothetical protein HKO56_00045 [Bacteroidia bacterium]|nr:hypothetical protein [Bacteroidia bacterium]NNM15013.1 hypothetical protein [Bacteroidia bacterium]
MRFQSYYLVILICLLFSCQKTDVNYIAEPFYNRCIVNSINNTDAHATTKIMYQYDLNGNLIYKLYQDISTNDYLAIDTVYYLPSGLIGRIEYQEKSNRALPKTTFSHNYNDDKIEQIFETGFINNFPYVITYNYIYNRGKLESIEKIGDLVHPNFKINNIIYNEANVVSGTIQLANSNDLIDLHFSTDNFTNIKKYLLPYPNAILFRNSLNNITQITNTQSFVYNGVPFPANSILFNQELIFNDEGALLTSIESKSELGIFSTSPSIKHFSYSCE